MEKHRSGSSSSRYPTRTNRANARTVRETYIPPPLVPTSSHRQVQASIRSPFPSGSDDSGATEYRPGMLLPMTSGIPSHQNLEPSIQSPVHQYPSHMPVRLDEHGSQDMAQIPLPSPGSVTNGIPSPPPQRDFADYPQSAYNYGTWTATEDKTLMLARGQGHHWASIQRTHFPSKTANACRKRYERLLERRGIHDLDREKLERVAHEYMGMRKEIWSGLAARIGERWSVVEAQCMSAGLRTIQANSRSHARRQRQESRINQRASTNPFANTDAIDRGNDMMLPNGSPSAALLAPVGFAPISPLDDESGSVHNHHTSHGWAHAHEEDQEEDGDGERDDTPIAEVATPSTSSTGDHVYHHHQGPFSMSTDTGGMGSNAIEFMGYMNGQISQRR